MYASVTDIFFDLDHTLWDFDKNSELAFEKIFAEKNLDINLKEFIEQYIPTNVKYWEQFRKDEITQAELRFGRLKETFDLINYKTDNQSIEELSHLYIQYLPQFNILFDHTIEVLDYLSSKYKLHIITNGFQDVQDKKIDNSFLRKYFKTITNSELAGVKKPNPKIFEYALDWAKTTNRQSVMIGDCLVSDVEGAINVGIQAIFFNPFSIKVDKKVAQINSLKELKEIF
jgi:YjjG family noncanonical pyrimidine nucleotidase